MANILKDCRASKAGGLGWLRWLRWRRWYDRHEGADTGVFLVLGGGEWRRMATNGGVKWRRMVAGVLTQRALTWKSLCVPSDEGDMHSCSLIFSGQ